MSARTVRPGLPPIPARIARLRVDERGYPVPWFVEWIDGKPDFRVTSALKIGTAIKEHRCWTCGGVTGTYLAFVIGPMCAINRISSEPPSHRECAEFSAIACPFLTMPRMHRRENNLPHDIQNAAGLGLKRNPGVALVWVTKSYELQFVERGKPPLFKVGDPEETLWFAEGRQATREEVLASIDSGLPSPREIAELQGAPALTALASMHADALRLLPAS